jgi:uncharacterized LabA/DUF88 family protein
MRVAIFIDGNNFFHGTRENNIRVDYRRLLALVIGKDELVCSYFYTGSNDTDEKQRSFLHWMRRNGFRVIQKPVKLDANQKWQAHLEVEIATDMVYFAPYYDRVVLVSGDEDFVHPLKRISDNGKRVTVAGFRNSMANKVLDIADEFIELDSFVDQIEHVGD